MLALQSSPQRWLSLSVAMRVMASAAGRVPASSSSTGGGLRSFGVGCSADCNTGTTAIDLQRIGRSFSTLRGGAERAMSSSAASSSSSVMETTPAIIFDIDGVFKHGGHWDPKGAEVLHKVAAAGMPYAFMTNGGGGRTEEQYAAELSAKLNAAGAGGGTGTDVVLVAASNMILSYSPWRQDLAALRNQPVLVVGDPAGPILAAANAYGWTKAMHISEYSARHPLMNPFKHDNTAIEDDSSWDEEFKAVCVFTDPKDFFEALQLCSDALLSSRPGITEVEKGHTIPIFFSNPDLLWKTQYPFGRFGQVRNKANWCQLVVLFDCAYTYGRTICILKYLKSSLMSYDNLPYDDSLHVSAGGISGCSRNLAPSST